MKRSQVSIYIILGLILLVLMMLFMFLRETESEKKGQTSPYVDEVPSTYKSIQNYVLGCVEDVSIEAVKRAGEHGGYVNISNPDYSPHILQDSDIPTESDYINMGRENHPVPYYWYLKSENTCMNCEVSNENIPSIEEIEKQLGMYVDKNIDQCLVDLRSYKNQGYVVEKEEPETDVNIVEGKVIVQTKYPMSLSYNNTATVDIEDFGVDLHVPFLKAYNLSLSITSKQGTEQFLEEATMSLISSYSGLANDKLPPIVHVDEGYNTVVWSKTAVKEQLTNILKSYIPVFRVENTQNGETIEGSGKFQDAFFENTFIKNNISLQQATVNFMMLDWPIYFDITPNEGDLLKPSSFKNQYPYNMIPSTQTNHYEFFYDISYPVLVTISDEEALKGEGFDFMFALETNVRDNKNLHRWYTGNGTIGGWDYNNARFQVNPATTQKGGENFSHSKSLMCEDKQRVVGPVNITVASSYSEYPVEGATLSFKCGTHKVCDIGKTDEEGYISTKIPLCVGGGITVEKEGYRPFIIDDVISNTSESAEYDITLEKLQKKTIKVNKRHYYTLQSTEEENSTHAWEIVKNQTGAPFSEEKVILNFNKRKDEYYENDFTKAVIVNGSEEEEVELVPGEYEVRGTLLDEEGVITEQVDKDYEGKEVTIPSVNMTPVQLGGVRLNNNTGLWEVTEEQLDNEVINFYVIGYSRPETVLEMEYMGDIEKHSKKYREYLEPTFE